MISIPKDDFYACMQRDGWIDIEQGRVIYADYELSDNGEAIWHNDKEILDNQHRFLRVPHMNPAWDLVELIKRMVSQEVLVEHNLDITPFENVEMRRRTPRLSPLVFTDEECAFAKRCWEVLDDPRLNQAWRDDRTQNIQTVGEQWCYENGVELVDAPNKYLIHDAILDILEYGKSRKSSLT